MDLPNQTVTVVNILLVILVTTAGCTMDLEESQTTTVETTEETSITEKTERTERQMTRETTTEQPTTTVDLTRGLPYELSVNNYRGKEVEVVIKIVSQRGFEVYNNTVIVSGKASEEYNITFPEAGSYEVIASTELNNERKEWKIISKDPDSAASITLTKDGELQITVEWI